MVMPSAFMFQYGCSSVGHPPSGIDQDILRPLVWVRILINVRRSTRRRFTHLASWFMLSRRRSGSQAFRRQHNILSPLVRVCII
jgi:hypothetical protein